MIERKGGPCEKKAGVAEEGGMGGGGGVSG